MQLQKTSYCSPWTWGTRLNCRYPLTDFGVLGIAQGDAFRDGAVLPQQGLHPEVPVQTDWVPAQPVSAHVEWFRQCAHMVSCR